MALADNQNCKVKKITELKLDIDLVSDAISEKISQNLTAALDELLMQRHDMLAELIALHQTDEDRLSLLDYLGAVRERDYKLMRVLAERRDSIKDSLLKMSKIKEYVR
jgi:hypothetical protein